MKKIIVLLFLIVGVLGFSIDVDIKNIKWETSIEEVEKILGKGNFEKERRSVEELLNIINSEEKVKRLRVSKMKLGTFELNDVYLVFKDEKFYYWQGNYTGSHSEVKKIKDAFIKNYNMKEKHLGEMKKINFEKLVYDNSEKYIELVFAKEQFVTNLKFEYWSPRKYNDKKQEEQKKEIDKKKKEEKMKNDINSIF